MLKPKMLINHSLVYGTDKGLQSAIEELSEDIKNFDIPTMTADGEGLVDLLKGFCEKLPEAEEGDVSFVVFAKNPQELFAGEYEGSEIEELLENALSKGVVVCMLAAKKDEIPDYIRESLGTELEAKVEKVQKAAKAAREEAAQVLKEELENSETQLAEYESEPATKPKKSSKKKNEIEEVEEDEEKQGESVMEKAIRRSASAAVSSASRSVSTNLVNSVTKSGKTKSAEQVIKQVGTTALSAFLRNMINGEVQEVTKSTKKSSSKKKK